MNPGWEYGKGCSLSISQWRMPQVNDFVYYAGSDISGLLERLRDGMCDWQAVKSEDGYDNVS